MIDVRFSKLDLVSFKGKTSTITFRDEVTEIYGRNGEGKSSIADAIAFILSGSPINGEKGDVITQKDSFARATLYVTIGDSPECIITREIKKTNSGASSTLRINHVERTQADLNSMFGDISPKTLVAMIFPNSFMFSTKAVKQDILLSSSKMTFKKIVGVTAPISSALTEIKELDNTISALIEEIEACPLKRFIDFESIAESFDLALNGYPDWETFCQGETSKAVNEIIKSSTGESYSAMNDLMEYIKLHKNKDERMDLIEEYAEEVKKLTTAQKNLERAKSDIQDLVAQCLKKSSEVFKLFGVSVVLEKETSKSTKSVIDVYYNSLPIENCSTSEQIKTGVNISLSLQSMAGLSLPVIVDNAESIVGSLPVPKGHQALAFFVSDMPLSIGMDDVTAQVIETENVIPRTPVWKIRTVTFAKKGGAH